MCFGVNCLKVKWLICIMKSLYLTIVNFILILAIVVACSENESKKKSIAKELLLEQCEVIISKVDVMYLSDMPEDSYAASCDCISEIIAADLAENYSSEKINRMKEIPYELVREIESKLIKHRDEIGDNCLSRTSQ